MSYDLFLGCVLPARLPFLEASSRKVFEKLGINLNDVDGFSCCPDPTGIELIDHKTWLALGARNLSLCNTNDGVVSFCSGLSIPFSAFSIFRARRGAEDDRGWAPEA